MVADSFPKIYKNEVILCYLLIFLAILKFQLVVKFPEHHWLLLMTKSDAYHMSLLFKARHHRMLFP